MVQNESAESAQQQELLSLPLAEDNEIIFFPFFCM